MNILIMAAVLITDQITKYWIQAAVALHADTPVIPGFFYITYVKNDGAAWNILSGRQSFLSLLAAAVIVGALYYLFKNKAKLRKLEQVAISLIISGAAGNLIDRLVFGYVRDFLHFYIFGYDFPVFNVADSALCIGVGLFIIATILEDRKKENDTRNISC